MATLSNIVTKGVEIIVHIKNDGYNEAELRNAGVEIICNHEQSIQCAVIDKSIVWYGNINFFGFNIADTNIMRIADSKVANEIIEVLYDKEQKAE